MAITFFGKRSDRWCANRSMICALPCRLTWRKNFFPKFKLTFNNQSRRRILSQMRRLDFLA
jgi:hypothetical protein